MGQYWKTVRDLGYQEMSVNNTHVWHSIRKIGYMQVKRMILSVGHVCVRLVCRVAFGEIILKCLIVGSRVYGRKCAFGGIFDTALRDVLWVWYNSHFLRSYEGVV